MTGKPAPLPLPDGGFRRLKHGAFCRHIRKRYSDKRTREGKQLDAILRALANDLGGVSNLNAGQLLLLDSIRSLLIPILQISKYVDSQESIINENGELIPALSKNFLAYQNSLRLALAELYKSDGLARCREPDLKTILSQHKGEK